MEKITVKVRDGVVTIPPIAKVVKDGKIIRLIKVQENTEYKGYYHITYVYPYSCGKGECSSEVAEKLASHKAKFIEVMDDDFNTADGVSVIFELATDIFAWVASGVSRGSAEAASALFGELCGLMGFIEEKQDDGELIKYIEEQIELRNQAKKDKNYAEADRIRAELAEKGVTIKDTRQGTTYTVTK